MCLQKSQGYYIILGQKSCHVAQLGLLFWLYWRSKCRLCLVQVDQTYQPWCKWCRLPPYCPYLATSTISPYNLVNTIYHGKCSNDELFIAFFGQIRQIDTAFHTPTSSRESRELWLGCRHSASPLGIVQLVIQNVSSRRDQKTNKIS